MLTRQANACLLTPEQLTPTDERLKVVSVFNPGAIEHDGQIILMARVAEAVVEQRPGQIALPRWQDGEIVIDWMADEELTPIDPRIVLVDATATRRLTFTSHLRVWRLSDPLALPDDQLDQYQRIDPATYYEAFGLEDPRIVPLDDAYYITCVAVSKHGACTALMRTTDFTSYERLGVIFPPENKDVVLFPERIGGRYAAIHRPNPHQHFNPPEMWIGWSDDLVHWGGHEPLPGIGGRGEWRMGRIGGGCPPAKTDRGWIEIYHGNSKKPGSPTHDVGVYSAAALLLDLANPGRILAQTDEPIMMPGAEFETSGFVPDIVFPTGIIERDGRYFVYYGAADAATAVVEWSKDELLAIFD